MKGYFKTSDGNFFYTKNAASNHARTLNDKEVSEVEHLPNKAQQTEPLKKVVDETTATEHDISMPRTKLDEIAKGYGIDTTGLKNKQEVIDAIDAYLASQNEGSEGSAEQGTKETGKDEDKGVSEDVESKKQ